MDLVKTPAERFEDLPDYPYPACYVDVGSKSTGPLRMHYVEAGPPDADPVLLLHGQPTWSFLYRKVIERLAAAGHWVLAPDLIGFGRSDKPLARAAHTVPAHVEWTAQFVDALGLRDVTLVVQDWGGPIGLRWAVEHSEQVGRLVIMNTGLFSGRVSKGFMAWREFAERTPDMPIGRIMQGATSTELGDEVIAGYEAPFPTPESKAGAQRFPLLVPLSETDPGVSELLAVKDELSRWTKPALVAFSDLDPVFPFPQSGEQFTNLIPSAGEQVRIEGAAHFLQEDRGPQIVEAMLAAFGETSALGRGEPIG